MNTALNGVGGFVGFHYAAGTALAPEQVGFSWSTAGHHYEGLAQLATGLTNPATPDLAFLPGPVGRWFNASTEAQMGFVPGLVGIDLFNHDPNHHWATDWNHDPLYNWKTNPAGTAGSVGFNLVTLAIPGPKGLGALTKGSKAARATEEGGTLAKGTRAADDLTDLTKTTAERADLAKSITGVSKTDLGNLTKTTDLDKTVKGLDNLNKYDDFNVPHDATNTHHTNHSADAPAPRSHESAGDSPTGDHTPAHNDHGSDSPQHHGDSSSDAPGSHGDNGSRPTDAQGHPLAKDGESGYHADGVWRSSEKADPNWTNSYRDNIAKGEYGERVSDEFLQQHNYQQLGAPHQSVSRNGIDGIYRDPKTGHPVIVESKYEDNGLSTTKNTGKQLTDTWLNGRLGRETRLETATGGDPRLLREIHSGLRSGDVKRYLANVCPDGAVKVTEIDPTGSKIGTVNF